MTSGIAKATSFELRPHPRHPPTSVRSVRVEVAHDDVTMRVRWRVEGAQALVVPPVAADRARADGLWQATCFELFVQADGGEAYVEVNLSPSGRWNVYDFTRRREGMAPRPFPRAPDATMVRRDDDGGVAIFEASLPREGLPQGPYRFGLTAVLEEWGGSKSYWALAHGSPDAPDFHDPAAFIARFDNMLPP
jgi:hypothetical protein